MEETEKLFMRIACFSEWHFALVNTIWHKADSHVFLKACFNVYGRQIGAFVLTSVCFEVTNEHVFETYSVKSQLKQ